MASEDENWIRPAAAFEKIYEMAHKRTTFLLVYKLSFSSVLPLQETHVKDALTHLHRKCPCLRVCFGERNGQTWLRYTSKEEIDFQVMKDVGHEEIQDLLQVYQYKSEEGPLWCARVLLNTEKDPLALDKDLPYTSHLFFGMHHGITDGFTMMKICSGFVKILNDVIGNTPINDKDQLGYLVSYSEADKYVAAKKSAIQKDPSLMQDVKSRLEEKDLVSPLLFKVEPPPYGEEKTNVLTRVLDQDTTRKFFNSCKANSVTFNSGFSALVNAAIVSLLVENKCAEDSNKISNGHVINLRRYESTDSSDGLGCYILPALSLCVNVPKNINTNFWDFARSLHQDLHHCIENKYIFLVEAYTQLAISKEKYEDEFFSSKPTRIECMFSNLGDVTHHFKHNGPHATLYFLGRHVSLHNSDLQNIIYFFHTFRGRLTLSVMYDTKYVTKSLALKLCDRIFYMMENVINGSIY